MQLAVTISIRDSWLLIRAVHLRSFPLLPCDDKGWMIAHPWTAVAICYRTRSCWPTRTSEKRYARRRAFTSYIFTTTRRLFYRRWAIGKSSGEYLGSEAGRPSQTSGNQSPEMRLDIEALDRALARLPEKQREAVILFEISGLSLAEIRDVQGGSLSGVKSRIVRGREQLAVLLGERGGGVAAHHAERSYAKSKSFERSQVATLMREKL